MASAADRFTRLQKVAVFLITLGEEKTRQVLEALDLASISTSRGALFI
jgi:flagellar motor switch protein FliG